MKIIPMIKRSKSQDVTDDHLQAISINRFKTKNHKKKKEFKIGSKKKKICKVG